MNYIVLYLTVVGARVFIFYLDTSIKVPDFIKQKKYCSFLKVKTRIFFLRNVEKNAK